MTRLEAALTYASWGWHVLPVLPNAKAPASPHGIKDATTDQAQITRWWTQNPNFNVGIAAGSCSQLIVFDIDPRNGGEDSWAAWANEHGPLDHGAMQITAGGGAHFLAQYHSDVRSCKLTDGVDLLSDGRYFLVYPSTIDGRSYQWEASSDVFEGVAPAPLPPSWLAAYQAKRAPGARQVSSSGVLAQGARNSGLTALAGAMRRHGMTEAEILAALAIANETRCEIPLPSSEVSQIVRSVSRYEPEADVAANAALGTDAAEAILSAARAQSQAYFFTRATAYLDQPAPLRWLVRHWIPADGLCMVYGESGSGKTFITLDIACHVAAGLDWHGHKTRSGVVAYLAGEGNFGMRQRVASWCQHHSVEQLDQLLISNKAIDLDSPSAAAQIINAIRELTHHDISLIVVDTVNNHMAGDENSARDTRTMLSACQIVARALSSTVCLNHHTGHAVESKTRARGSSAWRASLDASILVSKNDDAIEIVCTKMKDAEHPKPIYGKLERIPLAWVDDEGERIKGAVFVIEENAPEQKPKKESDIQKDIRKFTNAWWHAGAESREKMPYLSRTKLIEYLITNEGLTESTAKTYAQESKKGRLIYNLLNSQIIVASEQGWVVSDGATAATLMVRKGEN